MDSRLKDLMPGEEATIVKIEGSSADSKRLREMGIRKGGKVLMRRDAPLGDPMEISVMDSNVSLRRSEAEKVIIEKVSRLTPAGKKARIALVGNPNCGKTTLFNLLTGSRQHVGNWPGVTVEKKVGHFSYNGREIELVDLPGTYSMTPNSIEEKIVRNFILLERPDLVLNVVDGTTLERSLYLTTQLIDTETPFLVAVNMMDEVREKNIEIDLNGLGELLKARVIAIAAKKEEGIVPLIRELMNALDHPVEKAAKVNYGTDIEQAVKEISCSFPCEDAAFPAVPLRWAALNLLQEEKEGQELVRFSFGKSESWLPVIEKQLKRLSAIYPDDIGSVMEDMRFGFVQGAIRECVRFNRKIKRRDSKELTEILDSILLNRFISFPLFALILWATFQLTFTLGGIFSGFIGTGIQSLNGFVQGLMPDGILKDLLTDGIITGVGGILVFFPQIMILFFIIALLEDSGYMARIAFIMDRLMHVLGIHGKSFISMFMGLGCNVPGILAARTLENEQDRIVTVLINPFMSCSARLPIYVMITGIFFQQSAGTVIFILYMTGIAVAILTAKMLKTFFFRGKSVPFVMELPPYRTPSGKSLLIHMWERASLFIRKMGSVILVGSILIWALGYFPRTTGFSEQTVALEKQMNVTVDPAKKEQLKNDWENRKALEQIENSYIGRIGKTVEPFFRPLGFGWRESVALLTGVVGKEVVVSTLSVLYGGSNDDTAQVRERMTGDGATPASALAFLVFVLLYIPCLAAIAAVRKETHSVKWMLFSVVYGVGIGYLIGFAVNQAGRFLFH